MEQARYDELKAKQDEYMRRLPYSNAYVANEINSNLPVDKTLQYFEKQYVEDNDWALFEAGANGITSGLRGLFGVASAAIAQNVARNQKADSNYKPYGGYATQIAQGLKDIANSDMLTPYNVKGDNAFTQFALDLTQGATQLATQVGVTMLTGGAGGAVYMGASIAGNQYLDLIEKGVDVDTAATASLMNAPAQAILERVGLGKIMKKFPANTLWGAKLRQIAESTAAEGLTEAIQEYPEALTNLYAEHADKSKEELLAIFKDEAGNITRSAMYSGLIGAILGGGGSAANLAFNRGAVRALKREIHETKLEQIEERINNEKISGANPEYIANTVNNNMPDDYVYIGGETLFQIASEKGIEKTASLLGVTTDEIIRANEDGDAVEIKQGDFEKACMLDGTFFQSVRDDLAFEVGGDTTNSLIEEAIKVEEVEVSKEAQAEFDNVMIDIRNQMVEALIPKQQAKQLEVLLTAKATQYNPENPAQWFKDHPLQITRNGIMSGDVYEQGFDVTQTEEFKNWFADSKVLDEDGQPLIVYHGTDADFDVFDRTKTRANMDIQGNFFSPWELDAQGYGSNVRAFYLSIKNPADSKTAYAALNKFKGQNNAGVKAREYLIEQGYDGVNNDNEEYIAFYPEQIKSVDNTGSFDKNNPNVYYQESPYQNLDYEQIINSKDFIDWFGDWRIIADSIPNVFDDFDTNSYEIAKTKLREFSDNEIVNKKTGIIATVSKRGRSKSISAEAMRLSQENGYTANEHLLAVANIDKLYRNAELYNIRDDVYDDIPSVKEFIAPLILGKNKTAIAHLTVKETNNAGHKIYTVQLLELKRPAGYLPRSADKRSSATAGFVTLNIAQLADDFNSILDKVDENGKPLMAEVQKYIEQKGGSLNQVNYDRLEDKKYFEAINSGDMETVRKMVKDKAEQLGFKEAIPEQTNAYVLRTKPAPKKTVKVYKVFTVADDGSPTALFVAGAEKLPQGVWLDAVDTWNFEAANGNKYIPSTQNPYTKGGKTGTSVVIPNEEVKQELINRGYLPKGSKATKVTALAYRPGWHAGTMPFFPQGGMKPPAGTKSNYENIHRYNQVVFECELAADIDYTEIAENQPKARKKDGSLNSKMADLQYMPEDGYYFYATNPMTHGHPELGMWAISGSLKIGRALTQEECDKILTDNNLLPQEWEQGKLVLEDLGYTGEKNDAARKTLAPITYDENGNIIPLSKRFDVNNPDVFYQRYKGQISFSQGQSIINLFDGADASTVIHETGHYFVEALAQDVKLGRANEQMKSDWNTLLKYCEVTQEEWDNGGEARRKAHEKLAEGFETYLMEGKAPSRKLREVFVRFAKWLKAIYRKIQRSENYEELTDEVREVFDRMLASEEMIAEQARIDKIFSILPKAVTDNLSDKNLNFLQDMVAKAKEKAEKTLVADLLKNFTAERKKEIADYKEAWKPQVIETIKNQPLYAAIIDIEESLQTKQKAKTIARKYLNADGKMYSDWQEELRAVNADINDRLMPIVRRLKAGAGKGVSVVKYGDDMSGRGYRVSNNDPWYQEWFKEYNRKPSEKEYMELAYGVYTGKNDVLGDWSTAGANLSEIEYQEMEAEKAKYTAEIDELMARRDDLVAMKEAVQPFKHLGLSEEDRQLFSGIAEYCGFASGTDLANKIIEAPTFEEAVEAMLQEMVDQKYPDLYKDKSEAGKAAREALYNERTADLIGLEMELINEAMDVAEAKEKAGSFKGVKIDVTAEELVAEKKRNKEEKAKLATAYRMQADVAAKSELARLSVREAVKTQRWITAERRCAAKAAEYAAKKEYARAMGYKKQQMFNHACVRESMRLKKRVEMHQRYLRKQVRAKRDTWYREEYFNQACAIFGRMGMVRKDYNARNTPSLPQFVAEMREIHEGVDVADWIVYGGDISDPKVLTFAQFEDVVNALKNIKALARADKADNIFNNKQTFEEAKANILETLSKLDTKLDPNGNKNDSVVEDYILQNMNVSTFFEMIDGNKLGYFSNVIKKQGDICENKRADMLMEFEDATNAAIKKWLPTRQAKKQAAEKVTYEELAGKTLDKHELIGMLLYLTTESSSNKLCSMADTSTYAFRFKGSELWVENDIAQTRQNLLNFLGKHLTEADYVYAQEICNACNAYWAELADLEWKSKGFRPPKVEAYPAVIELPSGKLFKFTGGYMPLVRDRSGGSIPSGVEVMQGTDPSENGSMNIARMFTNTGSSKARDKSVYPLELHSRYAFGAVKDTITDIAMREYLANFRKILRDNEIRTALFEKLGQGGFNVLAEHFDAMARPYGGGGYNSFADKVTGRYIGALRKATVHFAIMGKISTALQNFGNVVLYGGTIEGFEQKDVMSAMGNLAKVIASGKYKELYAEVMADSTFMRERSRIPDVALRDYDVTGGDTNIVEEYAMAFGTRMLVYTDNLTAVAVFKQAKEKAIQEGKSREDAILYAEEIIRRTLGSSRRADVSSTFRADSLKLFTIFSSFFNTQWNQWLREARIDKALFKEGKYKEFAINVMTFMGAKFIAANFLSLMAVGNLPWEDDDEDGYSNLTKSLVAYPFQLGGWQTQFGAVAVSEFIGMETYGYRITPAQSIFDTIVKTARKTGQVVFGDGEVEEAVEPASNLLAMYFGIPQQLSLWFWNAFDWVANDMELEVEDVFRRRPVKER